MSVTPFMIYRPLRKVAGASQRGETWWVKFEVFGRTYHRSTGKKTEHAALNEAKRLVLQAERKFSGKTPDQPIGPMLLDYESHLIQKNLHPNHVLTVLGRLIYVMEGAKTVSEVTPDLVAKKLETLATDHKPRTVNRYRQAVSAFFQWLRQSCLAETNPAKGLARLPEEDNPRDRFHPDEIRKLVDGTPEPRSTFYLLAASLKLRRGELAKLRWEDVDVWAGTVKGKPVSSELTAALSCLRKPMAKGPIFSPIPTRRTFLRDLERSGIERGFRTFDSLSTSEEEE